jgi:amino acid transporter
MFAPIFISVIILSAIIYLAISRRSSFQVRIAALVALGAMIITVIICLFRIFMAPAAAAKTPLYPDMPPPEPAPPPNTMGLVLAVIVLLGVFMLILFLSLREQRRVANEESDPLRKLGL